MSKKPLIEQMITLYRHRQIKLERLNKEIKKYKKIRVEFSIEEFISELANLLEIEPEKISIYHQTINDETRKCPLTHYLIVASAANLKVDIITPETKESGNLTDRVSISLDNLINCDTIHCSDSDMLMKVLSNIYSIQNKNEFDFN